MSAFMNSLFQKKKLVEKINPNISVDCISKELRAISLKQHARKVRKQYEERNYQRMVKCGAFYEKIKYPQKKRVLSPLQKNPFFLALQC